MPVKYTYMRKKKLAKRIESVRTKKDIQRIKKIIFKNNPEIDTLKEQSNIFMHFHNLTDQTYEELDDHLNNRKLRECEKKINSIENIDHTLSSESSCRKNNERNDYKYSNKEKNIIRRREYEKKLKEHNGTEELTYSYDEFSKLEKTPRIFIKEKTKTKSKSDKETKTQKSKKPKKTKEN